MKEFKHRRSQVRELIKKNNIEALLVSSAANRFYLSGFELKNPQENESAGMLLIHANDENKDYLFTDARYKDAAKRLWAEDNICIYGANPAAFMAEFIKKKIGTNIGIETKNINLAFYDDFIKIFEPIRTNNIVEKLRIIKSETELMAMRTSCRLNHRMMDNLPNLLKIGQTEHHIAWEIEKFFRDNGAQELAFATIAACGKNAALPHAEPSEDVLENLILIDAGCRVQNYCSDQTRTLWLNGKPPKEFLEMEDAVKTAQKLAITEIKAGMKCSEAYHLANEHFIKLGVEKYFTHGLGHGIGLETHEAPSLSPRSDVILQENMVVTVEPGLYYPEFGGYRFEHMVRITADGADIF